MTKKKNLSAGQAGTRPGVSLTRRRFLAGTTALVTGSGILGCGGQASSVRPNILWVTSEDNGPHLGAYGDTFADTPHLDRLAARGMIYLNAWSTAPVCAPARTAIISGIYPTATGSEHMRSLVPLPAGVKMFPQILREAGYYCTNNVKEDYNLEKPGKVWDESSREAHWNKRSPGQPFFAVFNFTTTHESQIRSRPHEFRHDPARVPIPAYHPDTPEVRQDWAQYYDKVTEMDAQVGRVLEELEQDGLAEDTIVFYYADHGPGLPRSKRWPYNSGLRVPLIVYLPEKFRHLAPADYAPGGRSDRLVGFVDLAPTVLSLAGIQPPSFMQGSAFLGPYQAEEPPYAYGFRGRMDERYDLVRSVRDKRYVYIRNYMPHKIYGQYLAYMFQTPTTQVWKRLYDEGRLSPPQTYFWEPKPSEELYDLEQDPDEVNNLAGLPQYQPLLERFRQAEQDWILKTRDLGFLPEAEMHRRCQGGAPYELGQDPQRYPLSRILEAARRASFPGEEDLERLMESFGDADSAVRYWAAMGVLIRKGPAVERSRHQLRDLLQDESPSVRIVAAQALGQYGPSQDLDSVLALLVELADLKRNGLYVALLALNALDALEEKAGAVKDRIAALPVEDPSVPSRLDSYVPRLVERMLSKLA